MAHFDSKLISAVHMYPLLYVKGLPGYRDAIQKENAWRAVADIVGEGVTSLKSRWTVLRERYCKEKRMMTPASGAAAVPASKWQYFKAMEFLNPYIKNRRGIDNMGNTHTSVEFEEQSSSFQIEDEIEYVVEELPIDSDHDYSISLNNFSEPSTSAAPRPPSRRDSPLQAPKPDSQYNKKKKKYDDVDEEFLGVLKSMNKVSASEITVNEELDAFGRSIAIMLSRLPQKVMKKAKLDIFTMLSKLDIEHGNESLM